MFIHWPKFYGRPRQWRTWWAWLTLSCRHLTSLLAALGRSMVDTLFMMNVLLMMMEMKKQVIMILYYHDHDGDSIDDDDDDDEDMLVDDVNESELNNNDYNARSSDKRFKLMTPRDKQRTARRLQAWNKQGRHNHNIREIKTNTYYIHLQYMQKYIETIPSDPVSTTHKAGNVRPS